MQIRNADLINLNTLYNIKQCTYYFNTNKDITKKHTKKSNSVFNTTKPLYLTLLKSLAV